VSDGVCSGVADELVHHRLVVYRRLSGGQLSVHETLYSFAAGLSGRGVWLCSADVVCAQTNQIPLVGWILYLAVLLWALVYDTMYAMVDIEDDLKIGVKSTAILFGRRVREITASLQVIILALLISVGMLQQLHWPYYLGLAAAAGFSVYQQKLIFHFHKPDCFKAFLNNNWFGLVVFVGLLAAYL
jgi:4-hydroxybenzoate polyprenyltransferase